MARLVVGVLVVLAIGFAPWQGARAVAQASAEPVSPFELDSCERSQATGQPAPGRPPAPPGMDVPGRRFDMRCSTQGERAVSVACTITINVNGSYQATCVQSSDFFGAMAYICRVDPPRDGARQWSCREY